MPDDARPVRKGCTFCGAPSDTREFIFCNQTNECAVCDQCIVILSSRLSELYDRMSKHENMTRH